MYEWPTTQDHLCNPLHIPITQVYICMHATYANCQVLFELLYLEQMSN